MECVKPKLLLLLFTFFNSLSFVQWLYVWGLHYIMFLSACLIKNAGSRKHRCSVTTLTLMNCWQQISHFFILFIFILKYRITFVCFIGNPFSFQHFQNVLKHGEGQDQNTFGVYDGLKHGNIPPNAEWVNGCVSSWFCIYTVYSIYICPRGVSNGW